MNAPSLQQLVAAFTQLVSHATAILATLAVVVFFWGVVRFIYKSGESKDQAKNRGILTWGLGAVVLLFLVTGIIYSLQNLFFSTSGGSVTPFVVPTTKTYTPSNNYNQYPWLYYPENNLTPTAPSPGTTPAPTAPSPGTAPTR